MGNLGIEEFFSGMGRGHGGVEDPLSGGEPSGVVMYDVVADESYVCAVSTDIVLVAEGDAKRTACCGGDDPSIGRTGSNPGGG